MSSTFSTMFACGHEETSSTRIGTERVPGLKCIIRKLSCKSSPRVVRADSAALCSTCRKGAPSLPPVNVSKQGKSVKFEKPTTQGKDEKARGELDPDPLRCHPVILAPEREELGEDYADPYLNEFAELLRYGAHNFTRKHPDDVNEGLYHREAMPITPLLSPSEPQSFLETEFFLPASMLPFEVASQPSEVGSIGRAIEKKSKD
ncbi:a1774a79-5d15-4042-bb9f-32f096a45374 [Sclerotinia trifoliorum]|uniref:A1774a79-5d15-4042-bb9f-32f096a45374 n=1 Tax=Sclerotinia trifoliorum TaxID=28548 RepID=A0A8H2W2Q7_9HELO|nr:a1774a79-5d15-4042-bb9f-32f096a45374 [Sclerotinia trifoliorum]